MNKLLRILSTLTVGIGLILVFVYCWLRGSADTLQMLNQPSYYTIQNYWYLLLSGCGCIAFSIVSCFWAWDKKMDARVEVLPNAAGAAKSELLGWLSGSSLDTRVKETGVVSRAVEHPAGQEQTELESTVRKISSDYFAARRKTKARMEEEESTVLTESSESTAMTESTRHEKDEEQTVLTQYGDDTVLTQYGEETELTQYDKPVAASIPDRYTQNTVYRKPPEEPEDPVTIIRWR